jgi:hypothetical protein
MNTIKLVWKNPDAAAALCNHSNHRYHDRDLCLVYDRGAAEREAAKLRLLEERRAEFKARVRRRIEAGLLKAPDYEEAYRKRGGRWEKVCIYGDEPQNRRGRPRGSKNKTRA